MSAHATSLLSARRDPLGRMVAVSAGAHIGLVLLFVWFPGLGASESQPLIRPEDTIEVGLVSLPKSPTALPERATRKPRPPSDSKTNTAPQPAAEAVVTPPAEKTYASERAKPIQADQVEDKQAAAGAADAKLDALLDDLAREDLLSSLDADEGPRDRDASSPDGQANATANASLGSVQGDPEYAAYILKLQQLFNDQFLPLPALRGKNFASVVLIQVAADGRVTGSRLSARSGSESWDAAALAAVAKVPTIPLPPEKFRARMSAGYEIHFED